MPKKKKRKVIVGPCFEENGVEKFSGMLVREEKDGLGDLIKKAYELNVIFTLPAIKEIITKGSNGEDVVEEREIINMNHMIWVKKRYHKQGHIITSSGTQILDGREWGYAKFPYRNISSELVKKIHDVKLPDLANPAEIYLEVRGIYDHYLDLEPEAITLLAIFTIGTYFYSIFQTFPYLYLWGARQSGKTKTLGILQKLCFNGISTMNLSPSALFRLTELFGATLCIDESEYLREAERRTEMQTLLFAGYKKDGGVVLRVEGENEKNVRVFRVYSPKVMASINYPNEILMDRCIMINMKRGNDKEKLNREPSEDFQEMRDKLWKLLFTRFDEVYELRDMDFENPLLVARERELWRPLLVIAFWIKSYLDEEKGAELWSHLEKMLEKDVEVKNTLRSDSDLNTILWILKKYIQEDGIISNKSIREWILDEYRLDETEYKTAQRYWKAERIGRIMSSLGFKRIRRSDGVYYKINMKRIQELCDAYGVVLDEGMSEGSSERLES